MSNTSKKWFAANTQSKSERKICLLLNKKKIETYFPINKVVQLSGEKEKIFYEPLFKNRIFIYAYESELAEVKNTDGIKSLMYWHQEPAVISTNEIDTLKQILHDHRNFSLEKISVNTQAAVAINEVKLQGIYESALDKSFLRIQLPSLGYAVIAETRTHEVRVIDIETAGTNTRRAVI